MKSYTHQELYNLQVEVDKKIESAYLSNEANKSNEINYWMDWRVNVCKWLDWSNSNGFTDEKAPCGIADLEYALSCG